MRGTRLLLVAIVGVLGASILLKRSYADAKSSVVLTGQVTSAEEGAMEGVLVSAKKTGSTITTTVFTDEKGRYRFPASRLDPGHYAIRIRATGYDLAGPDAVDIAVVADSPTCPPGTVPLIYAILTGVDRVVKTLNFSCFEHQMRDFFSVHREDPHTGPGAVSL